MNCTTAQFSACPPGNRRLISKLSTSNAATRKWNCLRTSVLLAACCFANLALAQKWMMVADTATNFYTVRDSFYKEWENLQYQRGKGYKQFKRWEWFMEPRVFPSGALPNPAAAWKAIEEFNAQNKGPNGSAKSLASGTWSPIGPSNWSNGSGWNAGNGRINVVVQDPVDPNTVYVGAASGGLWRSTDGGTTWTNLTDNQPVLGVSGIAIDPGNTNTIYIGTGDGDASDTYSIGVLKSTDGGATWSTTGLNWSILNGRVVRKLSMHPTNSSILFAATSNGVYKTTDAGATWNNVLAVSTQDVEFHPVNHDTVYTCSNQFYRSTDGGNTFSLVTSGLPGAGSVNRFKIAVSADEPNWVYVVAGKQSNSTFEGIYRSTDSGGSFSVRTNSPNMFGYDTDGNDNAGQSWYDMAIAVNPANADEVYIAGINVWKSSNGGASFTINTQWYFPNSFGYVHADVHDLAFFGSRIYSGSDGGVYKSDNFGGDWTNLTAGITIMQFYDIGGSPTNANLLIGGAQDNGTNVYTGSPTWTHAIGADGMNCAIDPTNENIMYGAIQFGVIQKSTNGGASFGTIIEPDGIAGESGNWVTPYALDPADPNTIYVGYEEIYRSTNGGVSWNVLGSVGNSTTTNNLEIAPSNGDVIYISKSSSIYRTDNGGSSWTNISTGLPGLFITDIAIDPANPGRIWVTTSSYDAGSKVYQSEDAGSTWTNISGNLPNLPANCVAIRPNSNDVLYVGMDVGIYSKSAAETDWTACVTGLPNVIINEIEINTGVNKIQVGSYGRGAWQMDLPDLNYCEPVFTNSCSGGHLIDRVVFGSIDNQGTGCAFPAQSVADYTSFSTSLVASTTYPISLTAGAAQGVYFAAMIDFNSDKDFEDANEFFAIGYANAGATITGNIHVPATLTTGTTRLRILCRDSITPITQAMICEVFANGEAEDYSVSFPVPGCATLTDPVPGATGVPVATDLTWTAASNSPTGYRLDVGTTPGGTDILNNFNVGNMTTYDPGDFPASSTIYVRIKPFNANGTATGCTAYNFETEIGPVSTTCLPAYGNECTSNDFIDDVTFNTISNLGTGCGSPGLNNYTDYTAIHTSLNRGQSYPITLAPGSDWGQYFVVLVDFNQDGFFSPDEYFDVGYAGAGGSVSGSITVPADAAIGSALMRIICQYSNTVITFQEICGSLDWGEVEDYTVDVFPPDCTSLASPVDGATNVPATAALTWAAAGGDPTGYRLNVGTTPGGTDILDNQDVGNVTTYDPVGDFPYNATVYVTITPYNANGDATNCTEESFSTQVCIPNLSISNMTIPTGTYRSMGDFTVTNGTITGNSVVVFKSDTGVLLQPSFTVDLGGQFDAMIEACPMNFPVVLPRE